MLPIGSSTRSTSRRGADDLAFPLRWKNAASLDQVLAQPLRLEVKFRNADLYAFDMAHHFLDAQDSWLLKDGKRPEARLFDY